MAPRVKHFLRVGDRVGMWTALTDTVKEKNWARCDCGKVRHVWTRNLTKGFSLGCGCRRDAESRVRSLKHGCSSAPLYSFWQSMISRCHVPTNPRYKWYGAKGISVCDRWRSSFEAFASDMGPRPSKGHSIDRIDNSGNYEPDNCRWATWAEQALNKSDVKWMEGGGIRLPKTYWPAALGISQTGFKSLLRKHKDFMSTVVCVDGVCDSHLIHRGSRNPRVKQGLAGACYDN